MSKRSKRINSGSSGCSEAEGPTSRMVTNVQPECYTSFQKTLEWMSSEAFFGFAEALSLNPFQAANDLAHRARILSDRLSNEQAARQKCEQRCIEYEAQITELLDKLALGSNSSQVVDKCTQACTDTADAETQFLLPVDPVVADNANVGTLVDSPKDIEMLDVQVALPATKVKVKRKSTIGYTSTRQCFKCQRFGHVAASCSEPARCRFCGLNHDSRDCNRSTDAAAGTPVCCANCLQQHKSSSRVCPAFPKRVKKTPRTVGSNLAKSLSNPPSTSVPAVAAVSARSKKAYRPSSVTSRRTWDSRNDFLIQQLLQMQTALLSHLQSWM